MPFGGIRAVSFRMSFICKPKRKKMGDKSVILC